MHVCTIKQALKSHGQTKRWRLTEAWMDTSLEFPGKRATTHHHGWGHGRVYKYVNMEWMLRMCDQTTHARVRMSIYIYLYRYISRDSVQKSLHNVRCHRVQRMFYFLLRIFRRFYARLERGCRTSWLGLYIYITTIDVVIEKQSSNLVMGTFYGWWVKMKKRWRYGWLGQRSPLPRGYCLSCLICIFCAMIMMIRSEDDRM